MIQTTCPYCGVGCGVAIDPGNKVSGDAFHPANYGKLCIKGTNLGLTLDNATRLTTPLLRNMPVDWDTALAGIAKGFMDTIRAHGPDSVAFYVSGQFLTEDYYVANKLMKGFIGSANIDTNSRLCMASSVAGHVRAFGEDVVPACYDDIDEAELIIFAGSNAAWCHPILFQRALAARDARGTKIVVIDPRLTASAEMADLHLAIRPEADVGLFNSLLAALPARGAIAPDYVARHTSGLDAALLSAGTNKVTAAELGLDEKSLATFIDWFCATERTVTLYSQGVNQSVSGTDKVNAILNVHLATGRIGRPGMGPFSLTGQPNAMGGREVGGLANQLAAHLRFDDANDRALLKDFWQAPRLPAKPGLKAVDLFEAVLAGKVKALWIAGTNPAESLPRADRVRAALEACPLVVTADCWATETTARAHYVLPAAGWSEKDGTVTNSERMISRQRRFRAAPGEARPDWWMFAELAKRMGYEDAFSYRTPADIFREHAALSAFGNHGARVFNIGALADLPDTAYDTLRPTRWPQAVGRPSTARLFGKGGFPTADGRARIIPLVPKSAHKSTASYPFVLNTGRLRDQWHTMTRTGLVPELMQTAAGPLLQLHPRDAEAMALHENDLVRVTTRHASTILPVDITSAQRPGEAFAAMHWTGAHTSADAIGRLMGAQADPLSGQPGTKHQAASIARLPALWHGIMLTNERPTPSGRFFWSRIPLADGLHHISLTGWKQLVNNKPLEWAARICGMREGNERVELSDPARGIFRLAVFSGNTLSALLFIAPSRAQLPQAEALQALFSENASTQDRLSLLAGKIGNALPAQKIICVCHQVSEPDIRGAIRARRLSDVAGVGAATKAGTNCGSCKGDIATILRTERQPSEVS